jgi:hypothetical protein
MPKYTKPEFVQRKREPATLPEAVEFLIKEKMPLQTAIKVLTRRRPRDEAKRIRLEVTQLYREDRLERRSRVPLREVVRNRALRNVNITAKWLYACLADQHGRGSNQLDATMPTLKRLYGWSTSAATLKRALDALLDDAGLIECVKSQPHSKWARYRLVRQKIH